jgi:hypothetical protein
VDADAAWFNMAKEVIGLLSPDQQSPAAAQVFQLLMGATREIANDGRIDGARTILEPGAVLGPGRIMGDLMPTEPSSLRAQEPRTG